MAEYRGQLMMLQFAEVSRWILEGTVRALRNHHYFVKVLCPPSYSSGLSLARFARSLTRLLIRCLAVVSGAFESCCWF
jgi:hypothetical protein